MKLLHVVGARPNLMKIAPVMRALRDVETAQTYLVHTGQHYSDSMSGAFFKDLELPFPDVDLGVGSGSHAWQTAEVMRRFEPVVDDWAPDAIVVVGDVNSTLACALVGAKLDIAVAHVEAGLRSFDMTMPEEINRRLTDVVSTYLFTPSEDASQNLRNEGMAEESIHLVGNVMVDSLLHLRGRADASDLQSRLSLDATEFALVTLHRPSNVDDDSALAQVIDPLIWLSKRMPVVFPVHPRTEAALQRSGLRSSLEEAEVCLLPPLPYLQFVALLDSAEIVLTDSGGIQEEASILGTPCLTLRENTERPITISQGTNVIAGTTTASILSALQESLEGGARPTPQAPPMWDGRAAERIVMILAAS